jgi:threonylcarbamoyladenosine tRNA methylthiotransferase MtaB
MKAVVFTLGCKVNEVESASIMTGLENLGWETSDELSFADMYVLNTCAVTSEAEKKSRQLIARVRKFNPDAPIYVCGCATEKNSAPFKERGVTYVCGAKDKAQVITAIARDFNLTDHECESLCYPKQVKTRAFIKIQDGCNNFCSYCIIPYLRGRITSREISDIVEEVKNTAADEIVLTGINISAYGKERGDDIINLVKALTFTDKRIRLGSLECGVITKDFLSALKELKDFAPQFHLSLQSGSDNVLRAMNRHYTRAEYLDKCKLIYSYFADAAITTDIIVGFCGETESDFEDSLKIVEEAGFARVHAFAFSPREGTKAYTLPDLPPEVKNERLHRLLNVAALSSQKYISARIDSLQNIIFEDFDGQFTGGYTADYIKVYVQGERTGRAKVKLLSLFRDGALAEIVK